MSQYEVSVSSLQDSIFYDFTLWTGRFNIRERLKFTRKGRLQHFLNPVSLLLIEWSISKNTFLSVLFNRTAHLAPIHRKNCSKDKTKNGGNSFLLRSRWRNTSSTNMNHQEGKQPFSISCRLCIPAAICSCLKGSLFVYFPYQNSVDKYFVTMVCHVDSW